MNKLEQAALQALDALEMHAHGVGSIIHTKLAWDALQEALAEQEKPLYRKVLREMLDAHEQAEQGPVSLHKVVEEHIADLRACVPTLRQYPEMASMTREVIKAANELEAALKSEQAEQEPVAWKHDCAALCANHVELWIDNCPHCGKPRPAPVQQAEQEPVAWMDLHKELGQLRWAGKDIGWDLAIDAVRNRLEEISAAPVRTKDPCHPWQDLTDDEIEDLYFEGFSLGQLREFARAVIAADREKNK